MTFGEMVLPAMLFVASVAGCLGDVAPPATHATVRVTSGLDHAVWFSLEAWTRPGVNRSVLLPTNASFLLERTFNDTVGEVPVNFTFEFHYKVNNGGTTGVCCFHAPGAGEWWLRPYFQQVPHEMVGSQDRYDVDIQFIPR